MRPWCALGRGGLFFGVKDVVLHQSLYDMLKVVCACNGFSGAVSRFCYFGCYWSVIEVPFFENIKEWLWFLCLRSISFSMRAPFSQWTGRALIGLVSLCLRRKDKSAYLLEEPTYNQTVSFWDQGQKAWIP
jgi:hypothetical protein